ncbi:MAG: biotin/lipoyl-binding protein [Oleiphilaceae bacterium]|uniref:HlyD family secretion protein n=2 Tax=Oleiphilus sp. HI0125 TaxID=1822266 RepID=UPI0018D33E7B|nr:biotin/lipoyl-binding protein [Oleiphilus sp. HI0125]MCH2159228.1 biotin/lipoyl-binding protein [Oleiphilaceae bacterium]
MKTAVFLWAIMAFTVFVVIFYFHPKTYAGVVPFRTVSVVAQTSGPVTDIYVKNGQRVNTGDLLFRIENSAQLAALSEAEAQLAVIEAEQAKAEDNKLIAEASVREIQARLVSLRDELRDAKSILKRGYGTTNNVIEARSQVQVGEADLDAAKAQLDLTDVELTEGIPARLAASEAAIEKARTALDFTEVRSFTNGTVTQLALSVGSPTTTLVLRPSMVIIPDRPENTSVRVSAGFSQVSKTTLYEGMPAEIACDTNASLSYRNAILPARIVLLQPAVATGQVTPSDDLKDLQNASQRGTIHAMLELIHNEHEALLLDGSGCIVQTYTNNLEGVFGHIVAATGVVKAAGLRMKVLGSILAGIGLAGGEH